METRPPDYIARLLDDVVLFAYNVVWSIGVLCVTPLRGPLRLHARMVRHDVAQAGPRVLLYCVMAIFYSLFLFLGGVTMRVREILYHRALPLQVQDALWAALVSVIVFDLCARGLAIVMNRKNVRRRNRLVTVVLFGLTAGATYFVIGTTLLAYFLQREFGLR